MPISRLGLPIILLGLAALSLLALAFPQSSLDAAVRGLTIWWDVLFPSLFPFFVISEVLLGFGIVHFLGKLLDPLMKPVFRIPGSGGFVAAMGFAAGYPVSARLTAKLREQNLVSREEGERLVSFTTSSDPIFLIGAVSVGFFHNSKLAGVLALAHYGGSIIIGLLMRFHGRPVTGQPNGNTAKADPISEGSRLKAAVLAMHQARIADGRELGELLRQAISSSIKLMTIVGGLVVFFSVFLEVLSASGLMTSLYEGLRFILPVIGLPSALSEPFVSGLFEVTLGAKNAAAAASGIPLSYKAAAAAFILSWGGLSVHAQVASILNASDLRYMPFMIARFIHAVISAALLLMIWPFFGMDNQAMAPLPAPLPATVYRVDSGIGNLGYGLSMLVVLLIVSFFLILIQKLRFRFKTRRG
ncbi:sporulation integral membrane protein YlbJ [Paenibacillus caui]|uniref:sporulation integral membrane protein YlbJ n=1 Tax=Paenibacillus caui TaxID=2873927 RepID=UPI001CA80248|nr:sporulation integral membrane protein YlbJ [Paenibacillus caui]